MKITIEKVERLVERADVGYEVARDALEAADGDLLEAVIALEREGRLGPNAGRNKGAAYSTGSGLPATIVGQTYGSASAAEPNGAPNFTFVGEEPGAKTKKGKSAKKQRKGKQSAQDNTSANTGAGAESASQNYGQNAYGSGPQYNNYQQGGPYQYGSGPQYSNYQQGGPRQYGSGPQYSNYQQGGPRQYRDETTAFEDNFVRFFKWLGRVFRAGCVNYFEFWRKGERIFYFPVILFLFCLIPWVFWFVLAVLVIAMFCGCRYHFSGPNIGKKTVNEAMDDMADAADEARNADTNTGNENTSGDADDGTGNNK